MQFAPNKDFAAIDSFLFGQDEGEVPPRPTAGATALAPEPTFPPPAVCKPDLTNGLADLTSADVALYHVSFSTVDATRELISCLQEDALRRYTWHSTGLLWTDFTRYTCGSILRSYKLLAHTRHPVLNAVRGALRNFTLGYLEEGDDAQHKPNTYMRQEQLERYKQKVFTTEHQDKVLQQITAYGYQRDKTNTEALQKELREVLRELVVIILGSWGVPAGPAQKFAEDFFVERFDYDNVVRKLAMTNMGKLYLPFWSAAIVSLGVVTYLYLQRLINQWAESYFMYDKLDLGNHVNPDYYGRLAVACLETCLYDSSTWDDKRALLLFIMNHQVHTGESDVVLSRIIEKMVAGSNNSGSTADGEGDKLVQSYLRRFEKAKNEYNQAPYFLVDPLEVVGDGPALTIFSHLDLFSLLRVGAVCRNWRLKSLNEELWDRPGGYGSASEADLADTPNTVPTIPRFPPTHRGRALREMRNAILVRKSIYFEVRLKSLLCGTPFDEVRKDISLQRKKKIKVLIRKAGALSEKVGVSKETGQKIEMEGERFVDKWLSWDPWILQIPPSMKGKEENISVVFVSNEFGHISIDFVMRVEAAAPIPDMNKMMLPGVHVLSSGHVQLDDVLRHCLNWDGVCPLFANGPRIQPIIYVEPFLRFVETNFWSPWWRKGARKLTLNNYLNLTWTYTPPPATLADPGTELLRAMKAWAQDKEHEKAVEQRRDATRRGKPLLLVQPEDDDDDKKPQQQPKRRASDAALQNTTTSSAGGGVEALFSIADIVPDEREKEELRRLLAESDDFDDAEAGSRDKGKEKADADEEDEQQSLGTAAPTTATSTTTTATPTTSEGKEKDKKRKIDWRKKVTLQCGQSLLFVDVPEDSGSDNLQDVEQILARRERSKVQARDLGPGVNSVSGARYQFIMERVDWTEELFVLRAVGGGGRRLRFNLNGDLMLCDDDGEASGSSDSFSSIASPSSMRVSSAPPSSSSPPSSPAPTSSPFGPQPTSFAGSISSLSSSIASTIMTSSPVAALTSASSQNPSGFLVLSPSLYFYFDSAFVYFDEEQLLRRERQDRKTFAFKSYYTGKYLTVEADGRVSASSDDIGPQQKFQVSYKE